MLSTEWNHGHLVSRELRVEFQLKEFAVAVECGIFRLDAHPHLKSDE